MSGFSLIYLNKIPQLFPVTILWYFIQNIHIIKFFLIFTNTYCPIHHKLFIPLNEHMN